MRFVIVHIVGTLILWVTLVNDTFAQSFYAQGGRIADFNGKELADTFAVQIKGLPPQIDTNFGLTKVCFDITHGRVSDLKIELINPAGASIWLSNRNGGDVGGNYNGTCFRANGFSGYIQDGKAPFEGEYTPNGRFEFLNNHTNPNGTWKLLISDLKTGLRGSLNFFTLEFSSNPMPNLTKGPCSIENGAGCTCGDEGASCELLPDFVILPTFTQTQLKEYPKDDPYYPGQLRFAASIANIGDGPLETIGKGEWYCGNTLVDSASKCADGAFPRQKLYQRVYKKKGDKIEWYDYEAGTNYFDDQPGHNHFHVDGWVEFRLIKKQKKGLIEKKVVIGKSRKVSYCLFDSGICNNDGLCQVDSVNFGQNNLPNYGMGNYVDCKSKKQGISVGGYDTYGMMYEGQYIQLPKGLKSGQYFLEIEIDPSRIYKEKKRSNNLFTMPVVISKQSS